MIGLCGLSVFIGVLLVQGWSGPESFQYAMTRCCAVAVALFGGCFLSAYLVNVLRVKLLMQESDLSLSQQLAGYSMTVIFVLQIVIGLLPDFKVIALLLQFYIVYVVWEGCDHLLQVPEKERLRFTIISAILIIACPAAIEWIFNRLTTLLNY